ncbi:MAG TPA: hypothetical protein VFE37_23950 [Chloroflexota bacterium]|nr:hypothetical protein [Chloroflexota bacterium]
MPALVVIAPLGERHLTQLRAGSDAVEVVPAWRDFLPELRAQYSAWTLASYLADARKNSVTESAGESSPADEGGSKAEEGFVDVVTDLQADAQAADRCSSAMVHSTR